MSALRHVSNIWDVEASAPVDPPSNALPTNPDPPPPVRQPEYRNPVMPESTVEVNGNVQTVESGLDIAYHVTQDEVLSSAGTWGDFTRYLQLLPGVVWNSDMSNDVMVRGGNPTENLYVVDGIEVPNINHIALEGTTGGFTSMLDTATVGSVDLKPGIFGARYSSRLSSLIEVRTREPEGTERSGEVNVGISGVGGFVEQPFNGAGSLLLAAHRSILNLVTNDIGLNGVPIYTDGLARLLWSPGAKDRISALSLSGADSIDITPSSCDDGLTTPDHTRYGGLRTTGGLVWQHTYSPAVVTELTVSYSMQGQNIGQWLINDNCSKKGYDGSQVYQENTRDGAPAMQYGVEVGRGSWLLSAGAVGRLALIDDAVAQPLGEQSPFSANPAWSNADQFARRLASGQTAAYAEAAGTLGARWTAVAGVREETFALTGARMFEPRASLAFRVSSHQALNASYGRSSQLPPMVDILSYPQNGRLGPVRVEQWSAGAELWRGTWATASMEGYGKRYANEPESTQYPSLMLANMVDTLGQQFIWLPLKSGGTGRADGVELMLRAHWARHVQLLGSAGYSRTRYAAADGVLRPGDFDFPLVGNGMATIRLPWKLEASTRDTYATGRPYTPFNIALSELQSRGVYDLTRVNALRGPAYNRVDADFNRSFRLGQNVLKVYGGVENLLNRKNFLGYGWENDCRAPWGKYCGLNLNAIPGVPETMIAQMPAFPSFGLRYGF